MISDYKQVRHSVSTSKNPKKNTILLLLFSTTFFCLHAEEKSSLFYSPEKQKQKMPALEQKQKTPTLEQKPTDHIVSLYGDFLYFKAIADSLKYAQTSPIAPGVSEAVEQEFQYNPAFRLGAIYQFDEWQVGLSWMRYDAAPPSLHRNVHDFSLLAVLDVSAFNVPNENAFVNHVEGHWHPKINTIQLDLTRPMYFKKLSLYPIGGIKAALIEQDIHVEYDDFLIDFALADTSKKISGENSFWGVGPLLGLDLNYCFSKRFSLFFYGTFAPLVGYFTLETKYENFLGNPSETLKIKESKCRVAAVEQLQAGFKQRWVFSKQRYLEIAAGWEVQIFQRQNRYNWFNTIVTSPDGSDLTLDGPFARMKFSF